MFGHFINFDILICACKFFEQKALDIYGYANRTYDRPNPWKYVILHVYGTFESLPFNTYLEVKKLVFMIGKDKLFQEHSTMPISVR